MKKFAKIYEALFATDPHKKIEALINKSAAPKETADDVLEMLTEGHEYILGTSYPGQMAKLTQAGQRKSKEATSWIGRASLQDIKAVLKVCFEAGAGIDFISERNGISLLSAAFSWCRDDLVDFLVSKKPCLRVLQYESDGEIRQSESPLIGAALRCNATKSDKVISKLLDMGADPNGVDSYGASPLFYLAHDSLFEIAEMMIRRGANINHLDYNGNNMLQDAFERELFDHDVVRWCIMQGVKCDHVNNSGRDAFQTLESFGRAKAPEIEKVMHEAVADYQASLLDRNSASVSRRSQPGRL